MKRITIVAVLAVILTIGGTFTASASASAKAPVVYYVAIGDSLAAGVGATQPANDYVNLVYQHELAHYPGLQLLNLSCSGATTTNVLSGGGGCSYTTGTQLGDAEAFLRAHPGQVAFLTIDVGFDNVLPCLNFFEMSGIDGTCLQNAMHTVSAELPQILDGLRSSYPGLSIYGMDYYDGFLAGWLLGGSDQALAQDSVPDVVSLNALLGQIYASAGALMADPAGRFETTNFALTGSYLGTTVPQNVALICEWTLMCVEQDGNIHTNDLGYAELADSFEQVIDPGYWEVASDGGVFSFGSAQFYGSTGEIALNRPVVGITPTADDGGYWLVASDGGVFSFGDTQFYGSIPGLGIAPAGSGAPRSLDAPIVGIVPTADDHGYFMVGADGAVFAFGDAKFEGSCPDIGGCSGAAIAVMPDASGNGYWLVTNSGHVYAFGDAVNYGQPAPQSVPVTSAVRTTDGKGYWILYANGAVAGFGDAISFTGPIGAVGGVDPATAITTTSDGGGVWIFSANGSVFAYGDAPNDGGTAGRHLNRPIIAATGF